MRKFFKTSVWIMALSIIFVVNTTFAQRGAGSRNQTAKILCDILMLNSEKSDKVIAVYGEVRQSVRDELFGGGGFDFQSASDDERTEFFAKYQKTTANKLASELKDVLSEKELDVIELVLSRRVNIPDANLRGLRLVDLKEEQRKKIQPLTIALGKKLVPSRSRFFGSQMSDEEREKAEEEFKKEKTAFLAKIDEILTSGQKTAWKEKTKAAEKEIEEILEARRNFQR